MKNKLADIGVVGLAVMGENLALNLLNHHFATAIYNRTYQKTEHFVNTRAKNLEVYPAQTLKDFCASLATPRKIILMVRAGDAVDSCIDELTPFLEQGDIIIDGGNSHYTDTINRANLLKAKGLYFVGCGISGGEEGALKGPSLMPGCEVDIWEKIKPYFQAIAAKDFAGEPCCTHIGTDGAGHFVKMVHNGIEYADMQLIAEAYAVLKTYPHLKESELAAIFDNWNKGDLASYLIEITADILKVKDDKTNSLLVNSILDTAGQKGTGKWTTLAAMDYYVAIPSIAEAVFARSLSAQKELRVALSGLFPRTQKTISMDLKTCINALEKSLLCAKISVYAQGFELLSTASQKHNWNLNISEIARIWQGGCIIRANFLKSIVDSYKQNLDATCLLQTSWVKNTLKNGEQSWRELMSQAILCAIPMPAFSSALAWFDGITSESLTTNLTQAQRDFFGAHTFERVDQPRGEFFHHDWVKLGGNASSSTYNA